MKLWKIMTQNIISGLVGGALVMSSAQAQKTDTVVENLKTHKLELIDAKGQICATLDSRGDYVSLVLKGGEKSFIGLGSDPRCSRLDAISPVESVAHLECGKSQMIYSTNQEVSQISLHHEANCFITAVDTNQVFLNCTGKSSKLTMHDLADNQAALTLGRKTDLDTDRVASLDLKLGNETLAVSLPKKNQ